MNSRTYPLSPVLAVGICVFRDDGAVLLVRRAKAPLAGRWTLPGGRVELGEALRTAARRELLEECGIEVEPRDFVGTYETIERDEGAKVRYHYVIIDYWGRFTGGDLQAGDDASEVAFAKPTELASYEVPKATVKMIEKARLLFGQTA